MFTLQCTRETSLTKQNPTNQVEQNVVTELRKLHFCTYFVINLLMTYFQVYLYVVHFRLWSSGCRSRYQGSMGRLKFLRRPFCIIGKTNFFSTIILHFFFISHCSEFSQISKRKGKKHS